MTITIKDVATRAGVSPKTVSRVINGEAHVRAHIRDHVLNVVREMDYRPNAFARGLSSSRSFLVALFFDDPTSAYAGDIQRGALSRCREFGHHVLIEQLDTRASEWRQGLSSLLHDLRLAGAILAPPLCDRADVVSVFAEHGVPLVRIAPRLAGVGPPQVRIDDRAAARVMTQRLIESGHRDIAFILGNPEHSATHHRRAGFNDALAAAGLAVTPDRVCEGDFTFRSGHAAGERLLGGAGPPTAIFASNDEMAFGVLVAAMQHSVAVPDTVSVVGFDDALLSRMAWPPLTTIRQPNVEMAEAAVEILVGPDYRARREEEGLCLTLPFELLERASIAAPAQAAARKTTPGTRSA